MQGVSDCIVSKRAPCHNLFNFEIKDMPTPENRLLIFNNHFDQLSEACQEIFKNTTQPMKKGCRGIFESRAKSTKKCYQVKENREGKKKVCKGMFGDKTQSRKCSNYKRNMDLNGTAIINCQLSRLKREKRKTPAKVQEKIFFELDILQRFLDSAARTVSREANHNGR